MIAVYTDEAKDKVLDDSTHYCQHCQQTKSCRSLKYFNNLTRKNMLNIKSAYKKNPCNNLYDDSYDSYISLVSLSDFKENYSQYIQNAKDKRERLDEFNIAKRM